MLIDTSGWLAMLHSDESEHQMSLEHFDSASIRLTHNYILAEFVPLAQVRGFSRLATMEFSRRVLADPMIRVIWVSEDIHTSALELLSDRPDKRYSLCDAVSFVIMRSEGILTSLTTDKHFEQEGFNRLLKPLSI
jgi:predicted nucleic acid-binding protein